MKRWALILCLIILGCLGLIFYWRQIALNKFKVVFFSIGQGDSALINFSDGQKMLVDCGPDSKILNKLGERMPFYDRTIDYLLITHFDLDHYGGCVDVLRRYLVLNIITNGQIKPTDKYYQSLVDYAGQENAKQIVIDKRQNWIFGSARVNFIWPQAQYADDFKNDGNNQSIVFKLENAGRSLLFVGDLEAPVEEFLVEKFCPSVGVCPILQAQILKVGHHGSESSSSEIFLQAVRPQTAVISVGQNRFGHPSLRVLTRLERVGANIWRTDEQGDYEYN